MENPPKATVDNSRLIRFTLYLVIGIIVAGLGYLAFQDEINKARDRAHIERSLRNRN